MSKYGVTIPDTALAQEELEAFIGDYLIQHTESWITTDKRGSRMTLKGQFSRVHFVNKLRDRFTGVPF